MEICITVEEWYVSDLSEEKIVVFFSSRHFNITRITPRPWRRTNAPWNWMARTKTRETTRSNCWVIFERSLISSLAKYVDLRSNWGDELSFREGLNRRSSKHWFPSWMKRLRWTTTSYHWSSFAKGRTKRSPIEEPSSPVSVCKTWNCPSAPLHLFFSSLQFL